MLEVDSMNASANLPNIGPNGSPSYAMLVHNQQLAADPRQPGKIILANDTETGDQETFVPMVIDLPADMNPQDTALVFTYDGSDPSQTQLVGSGADASYIAAPGALRLWTKDADQPRNDQGIAENPAGDYIAPDMAFQASLLTWTDAPYGLEKQAVVYIGAVHPDSYDVGQSPANSQTISFTAEPIASNAADNFWVTQNQEDWLTNTPYADLVKVTAASAKVTIVDDTARTMMWPAA